MNKITLFACLCFSLIFQTSYAQVGIGTDTPAPYSILDVVSSDKGVLVPRVNIDDLDTIAPVTSGSEVGLLVFNTNATTGVGFYYWNNNRWNAIEGNNIYNANGSLDEDRTVSFGAYDLAFDNRNREFTLNNGNSSSVFTQSQLLFSWNGDTNGTDYRHSIKTRHNSASSTGNAIDFYLWNPSLNGVNDLGTQQSLTLGGSAAIFNESGRNVDFRVEGDTNANTMFLDASSDAVMFGSVGNLAGNNTSFNTVDLGASNYTTTIKYVADFDNGTTRGSTMGLGSVEFLVDGEAELFISHAFSPINALTQDLGWAQSWDEVFADDFVNVSDIRAKKDIEEMTYGLNEIMQLSTIKYVLKDDPFQEQKVGVIAQEIQEFIPEASVATNHRQREDGTFEEVELKYIHVSYVSLVPVLIKAVQEQQQQIEENKSEMAQMKAMLLAMEARIQQLESK